MNGPARRNALLSAAIAEAPALFQGWDGVMLSAGRSEKFRAFGCGWRVMLDLILGSDEGLPNARVLFKQTSVPARPADARAALEFAAEVTKRFRENGYDVMELGNEEWTGVPAVVDWRGDKEMKTLEEVRAEGRWLAGLKLAP